MITSTSNLHIKEIRKLDLAKHRKETGLFLAEGLRVVAQAIESHAAIEELVFSPELLVSEFGQDLVYQLQKDQISVTEVSKNVFQTLARKDTPQGIIAVIHQRWRQLSDITVSPGMLLIALQAVQNPGNLGSVLRICDAVGAKGLILLDNCTDPHDPAAVKASMGSIFTIPMYRCDFPEFKEWIKFQPQLHITGTSDKASQDCFSANYAQTNLLLMGSEREGLSPEYFELCHQTVRIPMEGACDSLNLAVATGIIAYQVYFQTNQRIL